MTSVCVVQINTMGCYFEPLADGAVGTASRILNSKQQMNVLDLCKTVSESALQLMFAAKEGGGNPKVRTDFLETSQNVDWF